MEIGLFRWTFLNMSDILCPTSVLTSKTVFMCRKFIFKFKIWVLPSWEDLILVGGSWDGSLARIGIGFWWSLWCLPTQDNLWFCYKFLWKTHEKFWAYSNEKLSYECLCGVCVWKSATCMNLILYNIEAFSLTQYSQFFLALLHLLCYSIVWLWPSLTLL